MFFLLYWTLKVICYFLMALFFAAYLVGLLLWTILRAVTALVLFAARRPRTPRDEVEDQPSPREDQVPTFGSYSVSADRDDFGMSPVLNAYLVDRH